MKTGWLSRTDWLAAGLVLGLVVVVSIWNVFVGLTGKPALWVLMLIPAWLIAIGAGYRRFRPGDNPIFEICLYCALWSVTTFFGVRLSYLGASANFPLEDQAYTAADMALGFHWLAWAKFVVGHKWLMTLQSWAYIATMWQSTVVIVAIAFTKKTGRNADLFFAMFAAMVMTVAVFMAFPSMGPAFDANVPTHLDEVHLSLISHDGKALDFTGIIPFPSFHTACALLFVWGARGIKWLFWPLVALNAVVLISVPFCGDHYLVDVFAGAMIAFLATKIRFQVGRTSPSPQAVAV